MVLFAKIPIPVMLEEEYVQSLVVIKRIVAHNKLIESVLIKKNIEEKYTLLTNLLILLSFHNQILIHAGLHIAW